MLLSESDGLGKQAGSELITDGSETPKYIAPEIATDIAGDDTELLNRVLRHDNGNFVSGRELLQS